MKKIAFLIVAVMLSAISAWAQIPAEVTAAVQNGAEAVQTLADVLPEVPEE